MKVPKGARTKTPAESNPAPAAKASAIQADQGNRITPSYVSFTSNGERLIGDAAKNQLTTNPENTIFDTKRLIGHEHTDPIVQQDSRLTPFRLRDPQS
ncbi:hypothetical protein M408DRAFT_71672 [Serendipita vermifera MAFF 305830]|uniref:Uncharacterized protein n=1 Tax=Serendipita vermifera MAFF 305830 TaxID=933852 RepID=A0A0C3B4M1_SERVB|nr:hypothetical protein M408DRAFT_71672 [Serendipita vermifera MAFF 305830]